MEIKYNNFLCFSSPFMQKYLALDKLNFKEEVTHLTEAMIIFLCDECDEEMCIGDRFYRIGLRRLCVRCLQKYALEYFADCLEVVL